MAREGLFLVRLFRARAGFFLTAGRSPAVRAGVSFEPAVIGSDDGPTSGPASRDAPYETPTAISSPATASAAHAIFTTTPPLRIVLPPRRRPRAASRSSPPHPSAASARERSAARGRCPAPPPAPHDRGGSARTQPPPH